MSTAYRQHIPNLNCVFVFITNKELTPIFECLRCNDKTLTVLCHPVQKLARLTDGIIQGYVGRLQQLNRVKETPFQNGKQKFVLSVKS